MINKILYLAWQHTDIQLVYIFGLPGQVSDAVIAYSH
jgi:hypothetical protein